MGMPQGFSLGSLRKWAIVVILSSISGPLAASEQGDWSRLSATWRGDVSEENYPTYSLTLKIHEPVTSGKCGTLEFSRFQCTSELINCAVADNVYNVTAQTASGQNKCYDAKFELRTRGSNNLEWRAFMLDGRPIATARLARLDDQAVSALSSAEASQRQRDPGYGEWVPDQRRGVECGVHSWQTDVYIHSRWSGNCQNGAHGEGTLELFRRAPTFGTPRDEAAVRLDVRREFGLSFEEGILSVDVPHKFLKFQQNICGPLDATWTRELTNSFRDRLSRAPNIKVGDRANVVTISVDEAYVVAVHEIAFDIFKKAAIFAKNSCKSRSNWELLRMWVSWPGSGNNRSSYEASIHLFDLDEGKTTWRWQRFEPNYGFPERADRLAQKQREQQAAAAERQRQADERQRAEQAAKQQSRQLYDNFNRQHAVQNWPDRSVLQSNPFMFDGQTIGLMASFEMMIDREKAVFNTGRGPIVVSRMPRDWQMAPNNTLMLAANVTGNEILDLGGMRQPVPTLNFVGVRACSERNCNEAFRWQ